MMWESQNWYTGDSYRRERSAEIVMWERQNWYTGDYYRRGVVLRHSSLDVF